MQKGKRIFLIAVVLIVVIAVSSIVTYAVTVHKMNTGEIYLKDDSYAELMQYFELKSVKQIVEAHYAEQLGEAESEVLVHGAISGMMQSLGDGYSAFYTEEEYNSYFDEKLDGSHIAQGMLLGISETTGYPVVKRVFADTAAYEAGVQVGDSILEIDGKSAYGKDINIILGYIRGVEGTGVNLLLSREGVQQECTLVRTGARAQLVFTDTINEQVGYISIVEFTDDCAQDFAKALESMEQEKVQAVIIDLRGVSGGYISEAAEAADLLLDQGLIATSMNQGKETLRWESDAEVKSTLPVAVLTDGQTSGVAEVFAAALQDRQRGLVMGANTKGNAASTAIFKVASTGSMVKLVTAYYHSPNGTQIQGNGVQADISLELGDGTVEANAQLLASAAEQLLKQLSAEK